MSEAIHVRFTHSEQAFRYRMGWERRFGRWFLVERWWAGPGSARVRIHATSEQQPQVSREAPGQ